VVVVGQLLSRLDVLGSSNDDVLLLFVDSVDLGVAVGVARVVQVPRFAAKEGGVDDVLLVQSEHVAVSDSLVAISLLSLVCHLISQNLTNVFNHNVLGLQVFLSEQPNPMDFAGTNFHLLGVLDIASILHRLRQHVDVDFGARFISMFSILLLLLFLAINGLLSKLLLLVIDFVFIVLIELIGVGLGLSFEHFIDVYFPASTQGDAHLVVIHMLGSNLVD